MKTFKILILALSFSFITTSCMKEEPEAEPCSCNTTVRDADGYVVSSVSSAEVAPISGSCSDLFSFTTDLETGFTTVRNCF